MMGKAVAIPDADARQHDNANESEQRKPDDGFLTAINDNRRGQKRTERAPGVAADLEDRLGKAEAAAGTQVSDARCFRMKYGRADSNKRDREEDQREIWRQRQQ